MEASLGQKVLSTGSRRYRLGTEISLEGFSDGRLFLSHCPCFRVSVIKVIPCSSRLRAAGVSTTLSISRICFHEAFTGMSIDD